MTSRTSQDCINFPNKNQSAEERDKEEGAGYYAGRDTPSDWGCTAVFIGNGLTGEGCEGQRDRSAPLTPRMSHSK